MSGFAAGLLVGQLSVLVVLIIVVRFFIFADSPAVKGVPPAETAVEAASSGPQTLDSVLEHTYYDVDSHAAESMDWFTVLLAMMIKTLRHQAVVNNNLLTLLNRVLHSDKVPSFIDTIRVTELNLGNDFPLLNNCRVVRSANREFSDGLEAQFDVDLKDTCTLGIETQLVLNYPKPMLAFLPVRFSVSLVNFSGRVSVSLVTGENGESAVTFMFAPSFSMEFEVHSLVGARSKLQDVPKLGQIVETTLRRRFADQCVSPNFQKIKLPLAWAGEASADIAGAASVSTSAAAAAATVAPTIAPTVASSLGSPTGASSAVTTGANMSPKRLYDPQMQRRLGEKFGKVAHERA